MNILETPEKIDISSYILTLEDGDEIIVFGYYSIKPSRETMKSFAYKAMSVSCPRPEDLLNTNLNIRTYDKENETEWNTITSRLLSMEVKATLEQDGKLYTK